LVLLYRPDRAHDWQIITTSRIGTPYQGYLIADSLRPGEYTFGIWNWTAWNGFSDNLIEKPTIRVVPNPAKDECRVYYSFEPNSTIELINQQGKVMKQIQVKQQTDSCLLTMSALSAGTYLIKVSVKGKKPVFSRVVINK